jgi:tetratricopeptide (TPR) repeat protein
VTTWPNQDEAFADIAKGIRATVNRLRNETVQPAAPHKLPRLDIDQFGENLRIEQSEEINVVHPYLLGDDFVGRKKELGDLTGWLVKDQDKILCIYNLGGTGKSALVWHWLHSQPTRDALKERRIRWFWCTFYARNYDANKFLRELSAILGGTTVVERDDETAQRKLQRHILERLKNEKWLLVLDGLEREMGAFANPEHYQKDSEEQDCRNEKNDVLLEERGIRDYVFADFLRDLLTTQTKVLITSRLFPENLTGLGDQPLPGVIRYPLAPMPPEDAETVWNRFSKPDGSAFQRKFFESVRLHPQVISVVAAAVNEQSSRLEEWFNEFSETKQQACLDADTFTAHRHRWLDLATRDVIRNHRDAWLTLCYIVRRSEASSVDTLMDRLVDRGSGGESLPGRFQKDEKLRDELDYLVKRRLIGVGHSGGEEMVDVHPVIRGQVWDYIQAEYARGGEAGQELVRHLELKDSRELRLRLLDLPELDEGIQSLKEFAESEDSRDLLNVLRTFYPKPQPGRRPWLEGLPMLRLRKDQAWMLYRTGNELMTQGLWKESAAVLRRATLAYQLCGDLQSIEDCRRSHNWQSLYGGALRGAEREQMDLLDKGGSEYTPYWLALLLAIRGSKQAEVLLQRLRAETNRWTLQTVAEAWFYLEKYDEAAKLARQAWDRREQEKDSVGQLLWEAVTIGLALVRMERFDQAEFYLNFAKTHGTGWAYNLVPMFALAGFIELEYRRAMKIPPGRLQLDALKNTDQIHKQYCNFDRNDSFQIPAAEAHLAMARVHLARGDSEDAIELAERALKIARRESPPFHYGSVVRRATEFLVEKLKRPAPPTEDPSLEAVNHEKRVLIWIEKRRDKER